jgi:hypothetical protein
MSQQTVTRADYPHVAIWLEKIHGRAAYRRALDAGGDYAYGPSTN